jgi:hypothetical protein
MRFAAAPMITFGVLRSLWDTRQEFHTIIQFLCLITILSAHHLR